MTKAPPFLPDISGLFCLAIFVVMVFFAGERALLDGDTLWHIKAGEVMIERGEILTYDIFSHTKLGAPWTAHEWLSEVIMAGIHRECGLAAVVVFYFILAAASFWLLFQVARLCSDDDFLCLLAVSLAFFLALSHLLARPHIFSWLLGIYTLYALFRNGRMIYSLPVLMIPWANLHGGFVLGLFLQGIFLLGPFIEDRAWASTGALRAFWQRKRTPLFVLILCALATGLNPFGFSQLLFPFHVADSFYRTVVSEWFAPDLQQFWELRYYLIALVFLLSLGSVKISWTNRLFLLFFLNAALTHVRHISIAGIFLTPLNIEVLRSLKVSRPAFLQKKSGDADLPLSRSSGLLLTVAAGIFLMALGAIGHPGWNAAAKALFPLPEVYSAAAVDYLKTSPPAGKMFNYDSLGDYLIYTLGPERKVFLDGRLDMYDPEIIKDYDRIRGLKEGFEGALDRYDIGWVIVPNTWPLVDYLKGEETWSETYADDQLSILVRQTPAAP